MRKFVGGNCDCVATKFRLKFLVTCPYLQFTQNKGHAKFKGSTGTNLLLFMQKA